MCIIIDTNMFGAYCNSDDRDMAPVRKWVAGKRGKIVYSLVDDLSVELKQHGPMMRQVRMYRKTGKLDMVSAEKVRTHMDMLANQKLESNDLHILALAKASGTTLLVTEDLALGRDFKKFIRGKIYNRSTPSSAIQKHRCSIK